MKIAVIRRLSCALLCAAAFTSIACAAEPVVPAAYVADALTHVPPPLQDEKDAEMAAAGYTGMWMPVVFVYDRDGALRQAFNGPFDEFLAAPLVAGKLESPLSGSLTALLGHVGDHAATFALADDQDYLIVLMSPRAMKSACGSCAMAPEQTAQALTTHAIRAKVVDVDLKLTR